MFFFKLELMNKYAEKTIYPCYSAHCMLRSVSFRFGSRSFSHTFSCRGLAPRGLPLEKAQKRTRRPGAFAPFFASFYDFWRPGVFALMGAFTPSFTVYVVRSSYYRCFCFVLFC